MNVKSGKKPKSAKKGGGGQPKSRGKTAKSKIMSAARQRFDAGALAYARLLDDPCTAPLAHSLYSGSTGGYVTRFSQYFTYNQGASDTTGFIHLTPGAIGSDGLDLIVYSGNGTALAVGAVGSGLGGRAFLTTNASAVRCTAACVSVLYGGTEQNRSGRLHYGHTNGSLMNSGEVIAPSDIMMNLEYMERMPQDRIDISWRPNEWDGNFSDPTTTCPRTHQDKCSSVTVGWVGMQAAVPITFKVTCVYEWQPLIKTGISMADSNTAHSRNTLSDVVDLINKSSRTPWVRRLASSFMGMMGAGFTRTGNQFLLGA